MSRLVCKRYFVDKTIAVLITPFYRASNYLGKSQGKKVHLNAQGAKNVPIVARSRVVAVPNLDFRSPARPGAGFTI
jgi:hypothetical protein